MGDQYNPHFSGYGYGGYGGGGYGGGWGGIAPVGLFGLIGADGLGRRHDGHDGHKGHGDCGCTKFQLDMIDSDLGDMRTQINLDARFNDVNGNLNSRFNSIEGRENTQNVLGKLGGFETRFDTFKDFSLTAYGDIKTGQALLGKDVVIAEKNIMHTVDKCCCEIQKNDDAHFAALQHQADKNTCTIIRNDDSNTQKVLDKLCAMETAGLRDEIAELRSFRNGVNLRDSVISSVKATTVGSNFNTGLQTQSNNSGQIVV